MYFNQGTTQKYQATLIPFIVWLKAQPNSYEQKSSTQALIEETIEVSMVLLDTGDAFMSSRILHLLCYDIQVL